MNRENDIQVEDIYLMIEQVEEIDEKIYNLEVYRLKLSSKIMRALDKQEINTVGEFLENVNSAQLKTEEKFLVYDKLEAYGIYPYRVYIPKCLKMPEKYFEEITDVFNDEWIIDACKKYNLKNIGLLANAFPDIFAQDEDFITQDVFFEKIKTIEDTLSQLGIKQTPVTLSCFQKKELSEKDICELVNENYIQEIENFFDNIINTSQSFYINEHKIKLKDRDLNIIRRRFGINCSKETLKGIGKGYGLTRERIRQIEFTALKKISEYVLHNIQDINDNIMRLFENFGCILSYADIKPSPKKYLIQHVLDKIKYIGFNIDYDNQCIVKKGFKFQNIQDEIAATVDNAKRPLKDSKIQQRINKVLLKYVQNVTPLQITNYSNIFNQLYSKYKK